MEEKILLIDDEEAIVRLLSLSLRKDGYRVVTALSGEEGIEAFLAESPGIVLTDIKMPGMDGIEVLKRIKEISPDVEVIIITGHGDIDSAIEALKYGASDFINKPVRQEALTIALARAKEKLRIKEKLRNYTVRLEKDVREATAELRRKSKFLTRLIKSSNDAIVATDKDFRIVVFNPGAERVFGYKKEDVEGKTNIRQLFSDEIMALFDDIRQAGREEERWKETCILSKTGEKTYVRYSGALLFENGKMTGSVAFFHDITQIKELQQRLVQSERLAAIGQTVAGLAHGIKNILHGLKGGSYLVDLGIAKQDTSKLKTGWEMVKRNINRTSDLVMNLLSYSKEREPEYSPCNPNQIVREVCDLFAGKAAENRVEIIFRPDERIGDLIMDPYIIHSVLTNLVTNAIDACIFDENLEKRWYVEIKTELVDGSVRFYVQDNGTGMDKEMVKKLFTSFFSTKGHRGTGLGLMVTRKLVEEHNGTISVESSKGKGTTFVVTLPCKDRE